MTRKNIHFGRLIHLINVNLLHELFISREFKSKMLARFEISVIDNLCAKNGFIVASKFRDACNQLINEQS